MFEFVGARCVFFALRIARVAQGWAVEGCAEGFAAGQRGAEIGVVQEVVEEGGVGGCGWLRACAGCGGWVCDVRFEGDGADGVEGLEEGCWDAADGVAEGF